MENRPLAEMDIRGLGKAFSLINSIQMPEIYFGDIKEYSSFRKVPGRAPMADGVKDVAGWNNMMHRSLRNICVGVASLINKEALVEEYPGLLEGYEVFKGKLIDHLRRLIKGDTDKDYVPQATAVGDFFRNGQLLNSFSEDRVPFIPMKGSTGGGQWTQFTLPNQMGTLPFLLGVEIFGSIGGSTSQIYSSSTSAVVNDMVLDKVTGGLTEKTSQIADEITLHLERQGKKDDATALRQNYFRLPVQQVKKLSEGVKALEHDFQLLCLMMDLKGHGSRQEAVEWVLSLAGAAPKNDFVPTTSLEVQLLRSYVPDKRQYRDLKDLIKKDLPKNLDGYYTAPNMRGRVELMEEKGRPLLKVIPKDRSLAVEVICRYLELPREVKLRSEMNEAARFSFRSAGRNG